LLVIVATGNHFLFDAAAGAIVSALAFAIVVAAYKPRTTLGQVFELPPRVAPQRLAA
jgi:hypothetical protein